MNNNERRDDQSPSAEPANSSAPCSPPSPAAERDPSQPADPLTHALISESHGVPASTHAEAFYFQKQIQQATEMTVVLEDGEELHGTLEWYDSCAIKLRAGRHRVLIYKTAIKYLYKTSDAQTSGSIMR